MKRYLYPSNLYLPDFDRVDGRKWATVACDQFTSQPEYWRAARALVDGTPSTMDLMLPEAYLDREAEAVPLINGKMHDYLRDVLLEYKEAMIYLERTQSDGRIRRGIVGAIDLEEYDYTKGASTLIRATEGTVLERIPPRVAIRRGAPIEMPHIMILIDDPERTVIEPIAARADAYRTAYDFDLMLGGGHVKGKFISGIGFAAINRALAELATPEMMQAKYGVETSPLLFAIGDGNHSLASAKALYEEIKGEIGAEAAASHPARYALCEIVNLHDEALDFEPIYRVLFGVEPEAFVAELSAHLATLSGTAAPQTFTLAAGEARWNLRAETPVSQLAVGTVQAFLDDYVATHPGVTVDYIHGEDTACQLAERENTVAILFDGMAKNMLFKTVICDGALPRKTFSMGHAQDKRYYVECRKIR
ncbi:MAG: DUF1015 domain-containing protein [Clostridia bacterium]|nr:DUF1015 domain-containing protein [Clostridia bacterium]